jgi:predicted ATPase
MTQYFGPDLAFDLLKGLVAGGASLALQVAAPTIFRALKKVRARWLAREGRRKK